MAIECCVAKLQRCKKLVVAVFAAAAGAAANLPVMQMQRRAKTTIRPTRCAVMVSQAAACAADTRRPMNE